MTRQKDLDQLPGFIDERLFNLAGPFVGEKSPFIDKPASYI